MNKLIVAVALALPLFSFAQTPDVLIEACNALPDANRRLECLKAAMGGQRAAEKKDPLEPMRRAFGNMQSSLDVGVSYNNYQLAILELAKAVAAFKQDAGEAGAPSALLFTRALEAYSDAGTFWERSISFYSKRDNSISYGGGLPVSMNGLDWLVDKYGLTTGKSDIFGFERGLHVQNTRAELWRKAKALSEEGISRGALPATKPGSSPDKRLQVDSDAWVPYDVSSDASERAAAGKLAWAFSCTANPQNMRSEKRTDGSNLHSIGCVDGSSLEILCAASICRAEPPVPKQESVARPQGG